MAFQRVKTAPRVHFIGLGGIGTSSLAQWFLSQNWAVSGTDVSKNLILKEMRALGMKIGLGQRAGRVPKGAGLVVYSQAVTPKNPEYREATRRGIPLHSYPESVGRLTRVYRTVAVAGAHGKSTTTGLIATMLIAAGLDPTVMIGTRLPQFGNRNFRQGKSDLLVLEADEYKGAFLHYSPAILLITNIDREHLDAYKNLREIKQAFSKLIQNVRPGGTLVLNADDPNLYALRSKIGKIRQENKLKVIWYSMRDPLLPRIRHTTPLFGAHNLSNAAGAIRLVQALGVKESLALRALGAYKGAWRRLEYRGRYKGAALFDDYAVHPAEIRATLQGLREAFPDKRLVAVFQPHQAARLTALFKDFTSAFGGADATLVLPVYRVLGRDINSPFDSAALVRAIHKNGTGRGVTYVSNPKNLQQSLDRLHPDKSMVIVMLGAGNIVDYTDALLGSAK